MMFRIRRYLEKFRQKLIVKFWSWRYASIKNAFVFGAPYHSNAGDQAQTYCIQKWLQKNYPDYKIRVYDTKMLIGNNYQLLKIISQCVKKSDMIFLHSGYHSTDLYLREENMQRCVLKLFTNNRIVFFPQTIFYQHLEEENKSADIYNSHPDVLLLCRDAVSYKTAERIFPKCKLLLFPDIVTTMIGCLKFNYARKGILLCLRNDKEARIDYNHKMKLIEALRSIDNVEITDTTLPIDADEFSKNREKILMGEWQKYARYKVVVTDRYHGTIFSLIAGTPVIVLSSTDHKLESGVAWFPDSFREYVKYIPDLNAVPSALQEIISKKYTYQLPMFFETGYYDKLKSLIGSL